jgi:hypothetical protein
MSFCEGSIFLSVIFGVDIFGGHTFDLDRLEIPIDDLFLLFPRGRFFDADLVPGVDPTFRTAFNFGVFATFFVTKCDNFAKKLV